MSTFKDLDVGVSSTRLPAAYFIEPVFPGYKTFSGPIYAFLIEHALTGKRLMFDLGMRKDQESSPPVIQQLLALWKPLGFERAEKDVFDSHSHVDHSGIAARVRNSATVRQHRTGDWAWYGYAHIPQHAGLSPPRVRFCWPKVTELSLNDFVITIGDCEALDYFSDGSLYILNSPGSLGDLSISSRTAPLLSVPPGRSAYADQETSLATIAKLSRLDANPDVLVLIAHDATAPGVIDEFPKSLNDWKAKGWKDKLMWAFLEKDSPAFRFALFTEQNI
ncbi:hypothetical protein EV421DRAFT_1742148 [Armillaria borealis]|uniref:Metallo-hydrolase/oxidoreductase n=1 Tax=Armillaria borealis TaxID=47425 RepID=A0AA39IY83_9AGAR|nr:hypothetical protein EV421DRAFT_1742148 [Armillaria borealis]